MKTVITHKNLRYWTRKLENDPLMQPGNHDEAYWTAWFQVEVTLEVPTGELTEDPLKTLALAGTRSLYNCHAPLTGKEGFNAQGLEGKVCIRKPLIGALMNMRDLIAENRGRIVSDRPIMSPDCF